MKFFTSTLMKLGIILIFLSIIGIGAKALYPDSYLMIAVSQAFIIPMIWGAVFVASAIFIKRNTSLSSFFVFKLGFGIFIVALLYVTNHLFTVENAVDDIKAVLNDELYVVEGKVIESEITERESKDKDDNKEITYVQRIVIDNEAKDSFRKKLGEKKIPIFEEGLAYEITALPNSRVILDFEAMKK